MSRSTSLPDDNFAGLIDPDHMIGDYANGDAENAPQDDDGTESVPVDDKFREDYDNAVRKS